jgi:hypothetical protein
MLALARTVRNAVAARTRLAEETLAAYDDAVGERADEAGAFLRQTMLADELYARTVAESFTRYRELLDDLSER